MRTDQIESETIEMTEKISRFDATLAEELLTQKGLQYMLRQQKGDLNCLKSQVDSLEKDDAAKAREIKELGLTFSHFIQKTVNFLTAIY